MDINLIGLHVTSFSTGIEEFARTGELKTVPMVLYQINDQDIRFFYSNRPMDSFRESMKYQDIRESAISYGSGNSILSIPGKAYQEMQRIAANNVNKVLADMVACVVVEVIKELAQQNPEAENIFFIDSAEKNKIIGRLGYLYLDSNHCTVAFVSYRTGDLLTDVLNAGNDSIQFDIHYFDRKNSRRGKDYSEIIPNDFMESLTETVFYDLSSSESGERLLPLRCDILSQGLSKSETKKKVEHIQAVLSIEKNMSLPFSPEITRNADKMVRIPRVMQLCLNARGTYEKIAEDLLMEGGL